MTITNRNWMTIVSVFVISISLFLIPCDASRHHKPKINTIYQFGDSLSDTGNFIHEKNIGKSQMYTCNYPYGETFFGKPSGRACDGRLIIDYLPQALGLPLLNPYLVKKASFKHGVSFAVSGATALNTSLLSDRGIYAYYTYSSLDVQVEWFKTHLKSLGMIKDCNLLDDYSASKRLDKALFIVGEIGASDYASALIDERTPKEIMDLVPLVIQKIKETVGKLIELGATRLIIPGDFPNGCVPAVLTQSVSNALTELRTTYPHAVVLYADYYTSFFNLIKNADHLGFEKQNLLKACCGTGGAYNFDLFNICGDRRSGIPFKVCSNPDRRVSWDGIHLTQKAYSLMAEEIIRNLFPKLK
ncbi:hypothetical protein GIB67_041873 [Kingdonia uniflora]|uniref:Uncharacterized protein n=1 Tax=Kingdonia uniflora TaxID=39325 RepID=A0A7J7L603_9MAGN|nr:hypothetical protein GIB67_041873 [Kingdonia uniflora]